MIMTQEEKQLLLKDLSARLPYNVKLLYNSSSIAKIKDRIEILRGITIGYTIWFETNYTHSEYESTSGSYEHFKPYLRPMSSMTEEEAITVFKIIYGDDIEFSSVSISDNCIEIWDYDNEYGISESIKNIIYFDDIVRSIEVLDYLLSRHFDIPRRIENEKVYKTMIEMDLALPAPEGIYKTN